jgi:catechol 2,3-dioxygenase-like lactoylglutathione lyase family enzyme
VPLNHVALTVGDRERSAAFYGRHFGLDRRVHDDEHLLILGSADGSLLALKEGAVPVGLPRTNHFGFQLADGDAVRRARERLRAAGVRETEWQDDRFVRVQVADPDGYLVELFAMAGPDRPARSRWTSFVADPREARPRVLNEEGNSAHRLRVEHNRDTLLVHLSDEDGKGWTVMAVDRASRRWAVAQALRQLDAAADAYDRLYGPGPQAAGSN